jgi:hypothetical protein
MLDGASVESSWFVLTPFQSHLVKSGLVYRRLWSRWVQLIVARTSLLWIVVVGEPGTGKVCTMPLRCMGEWIYIEPRFLDFSNSCR